MGPASTPRRAICEAHHSEAALKVFDRPRIVALDGSEAFAADDITVVIAGFDTLMTTYVRAAHVFPMNCSRSLKNRDSKRGIR